MPGILALEPIAQGLLDETVRWFETVAGLALPERRFLSAGSPGQVAWDCEQVAVACGGVFTGTGEGAPSPLTEVGGQASAMLVRYAVFSIQLVRCSPTLDDDGNAPSGDELHLAGQLSMRDCGVLSQLGVDIAARPHIPERSWMPLGALVRGGGVSPLGPEGPFHGFECIFQLTVGDVI